VKILDYKVPWQSFHPSCDLGGAPTSLGYATLEAVEVVLEVVVMEAVVVKTVVMEAVVMGAVLIEATNCVLKVLEVVLYAGGSEWCATCAMGHALYAVLYSGSCGGPAPFAGGAESCACAWRPRRT